MHALSQKVLIDTIQQKTTLDKEATISVGNLLTEGKGYKDLFNEQSMLIDSLFYQSEIQKKENEIFRLKIVPSLENINKEQKREIEFVNEKSKLQTELLETKLKQQKGKKWTFGAIGTGFGILLTLIGVVLFGG